MENEDWADNVDWPDMIETDTGIEMDPGEGGLLGFFFVLGIVLGFYLGVG